MTMTIQNNNPIPRSPRADVLKFGHSHTTIFTANAVAVGILPADAVKYAAAVEGAQTASDDQETIKNAYRTATTDTNAAFSNLLTVQGDVIRKIRAFAESSADPQAIYTLAQIPPVASPSTMAPPGKPSNLKVSLDTSTGWINLGWKCQNPEGAQGTSYIVKRRLPGATEFSFIGVTGSKKFVDKTFFAGPDSVEYTVQGQRSDQSGPVSEVFVVNFGQAGGNLTAFVTNGVESGKLAA
jgi:hypothetical protein